MTKRRTITNKLIDKLRDFKNYENSSVSLRSTAKFKQLKQERHLQKRKQS